MEAAEGVLTLWQRLWLRLGVNVDDQLWLRLNPIPIRNCNPSANPVRKHRNQDMATPRRKRRHCVI